jgi:hypothetical protein
MNEARAIELLGDAFRCEPIIDEEVIRFQPRLGRNNILETSITKTELAGVLNLLSRKSIYESLWLNDESSVEILVREEGSGPMRRFREEELSLRDDDNGLTYNVTSASDSYILFFLDLISNHSDSRYFLRSWINPMMERRVAERETAPSVFELIRMGYLRLTTVQVKSDTKASTSKLARLANAFLFQLAFNTDISMVPQRELDALSRTGRITRMRRNKPSEIDPPRRVYSDDLIHHYLLAVSTDNPLVEYLSHYHVLEHFFDAVFNDDLIAAIQSQLTQPAFSYRRKKDIKGLITKIRKSLQVRNETITFSEIEALKLTLKNFVDVPNLCAELESYDSSIVDFYRDNKVSFSDGLQVDLRSADNELIVKNLASRIYQTRNSLVHSKDGDKAKYTPFADDHALVKELPLMRFIAERTILENSNIIE